jgi:hypothetical protein
MWFGEETVKPKEKNMSWELQVHRGVDENKPRRQSWVCWISRNWQGCPGLPPISCKLLWTGLRMRLSSRKAAQGSLVLPSSTGNRGPSWDILSRPWRDCSVVPNPTQDYVLGYSQPSLRDWSVVSNPSQDSRPGIFSAILVQISFLTLSIQKAVAPLIWTALTLSCPYGTQFQTAVSTWGL